MKKYNKPTMKVHTCALLNGLLAHGSDCNNNLYYGEAKGISADFEDVNFEENE